MAKKQQDMEMVELAERGELVEEAALVSPPGGEEAAAEHDRPFRLGRWGEYPQWACQMCAWDTLDGEEAFWEHYLARHVTPVATEPPVVQVYDRFGRPV